MSAHDGFTISGDVSVMGWEYRLTCPDCPNWIAKTGGGPGSKPSQDQVNATLMELHDEHVAVTQ